MRALKHIFMLEMAIVRNCMFLLIVPIIDKKDLTCYLSLIKLQMLHNISFTSSINNHNLTF